MNWKEYKFPLLFLLKFAVLYLVLNVLYGIYIHAYYPEPDPVTVLATKHTAAVLDLFYDDTSMHTSDSKPITLLTFGEQNVLGVYEGCNGLNTAIVFLAFILSFGRPGKKALWFVPLGLLLIHIFNVGRIFLLFYVTKNYQDQFYFFHKYLFTAILFIVIFILWYFWISKIRGFTVQR